MFSIHEYTTIGEIADVKGGKRLRKGKRVQDKATGHPYLRVVDFRKDGFDPTNVKYITEDAYKGIWRYTITHNDVYISIAGTIGRVGIVPLIFSGANLTENAAKITNIKSEIDKSYLMYYLRSNYGQAGIVSKIVGTSQPKLALFRIEEIKVPLYSIEHQRKIAYILSAYDDLIENNLRRIKILEEMAQMIYREWFVHFRFPGHEKMKMVDSPLGMIPKGWEVLVAPECLVINPSIRVDKNTIKPFVNMGGLSDNSMIVEQTDIRKGSNGSKFQKGDTLFARITPCLENGKTGFVQFLCDKEVGLGSTEFIVLRSINLSPEFVYLLARTEDFRNNAIKSMSGASGRQRVRNECFDKYLLAKPENDIINKFTNTVKPMFKKIYKLSLKNKNLRKTRDLLLPKLISGEIDVEKIYA